MPNDEASARLYAIVRQIRLYLLKNPEAKDTSEGIHRWWLSQDELRFNHDDVQTALDFMVDRGWIQKTRITDIELYSAITRGPAAPGNRRNAPPESTE